MLKWLKSKLGSRKAQFFIISTVIIAVSLATISSYLKGYSATVLSDVHGLEEFNYFSNLKEELNRTVAESPCNGNEQPRKRNLQEFKQLATAKMLEKGVSLNITYKDYCPANISMALKSSDVVIRDEFQIP